MNLKNQIQLKKSNTLYITHICTFCIDTCVCTQVYTLQVATEGEVLARHVNAESILLGAAEALWRHAHTATVEPPLRPAARVFLLRLVTAHHLQRAR